jgi:putative alpha-1,2-mannosidase
MLVNPVRRICTGSGKLAGFSGCAVVRFDRPFHVGGVWSGANRKDGATAINGGQGSPGAYVSFDLAPGQSIMAKVGTSFTSLAEALRNLDAEIPGWDLHQVEVGARPGTRN